MTPSMRIESLTSAKLLTRTRGPRIDRCTLPPLTMHPSLTSESVAWPTRLRAMSEKTNFAGGSFCWSVWIGH